MIIVFDKQTKTLLSFASQVFDNGQWREPTLEELYPTTDRSNWGFVYVKDALKYVASLDELQLKLDANGEPIGVERKPKPSKIHLTTSAVDTDGDGLPELIADAQSKATITIEVKDSKGELLKQDFQVNLQTTGGTLSARRLTAKEGQAIVELTSSRETVSVTVSASAEGVEEGSLSLEFMPPEQ